MLSFLLLSNIIFSKQQTFPRAPCHARRRLSSGGRGNSKNIPGQLLYFFLFNKGSKMPRNDARRYVSIPLFLCALWDIAKKKKHTLFLCIQLKQMHFIQKENMHKLQPKHIYWIHSLMCVRKVMWLCTMGWCNWTNQLFLKRLSQSLWSKRFGIITSTTAFQTQGICLIKQDWYK